MHNGRELRLRCVYSRKVLWAVSLIVHWAMVSKILNNKRHLKICVHDMAQGLSFISVMG